MPLAAVLDASVIIAAPVRDTPLRAAEHGLYRPHWSDDILEEVQRNLVADRLTDQAGAERLVGALRVVFPEAMVAGYARLIDRMTNHPRDRHVLAAAVRVHADVIVTDNLGDFPRSDLARWGVEAWSSDQFLTELLAHAPDLMATIVRQQAAALIAPPLSTAEVLDAIAMRAPTFARLVSARLGLGHPRPGP